MHFTNMILVRTNYEIDKKTFWHSIIHHILENLVLTLANALTALES